MKAFTLAFLKRAESQLADIWLRADDRRAVTRASDRMEQVLSQTPKVGKEITPGKRVAQFGPLFVLFVVSEDDRLVTVHSIRYVR